MRNLPPSTVSALFYDCLSCSYTDQRKVEADIEVIENRTGDLLFLRQGTSQLSHNRSFPVGLSLICKQPIKKNSWSTFSQSLSGSSAPEQIARGLKVRVWFVALMINLHTWDTQTSPPILLNKRTASPKTFSNCIFLHWCYVLHVATWQCLLWWPCFPFQGLKG